MSFFIWQSQFVTEYYVGVWVMWWHIRHILTWHALSGGKGIYCPPRTTREKWRYIRIPLCIYFVLTMNGICLASILSIEIICFHDVGCAISMETRCNTLFKCQGEVLLLLPDIMYEHFNLPFIFSSIPPSAHWWGVGVSWPSIWGVSVGVWGYLAHTGHLIYPLSI